MAFLDFVNPFALMLALGILPIILLYLLKPKPKNVKFPSIMFIMRMEKTKHFSSFLKRFVRDPLLLVQVLIFLLLVFGIANPFFISPSGKAPQESIVLVMDGSASMQSTDISPNRFEKAKELAISILQDANPETYVSIIFAENVPFLLLKNSDRDTAIGIMRKISASDSPSNLQDAIMLGNDLLAGEKLSKKIYVFSDFSNAGDVNLAKGIALSRNTAVEFVKIIGNGKNFAITGINAKRFAANKEEFYLTFTVENFNDVSGEVVAEIYLDNELRTSMAKEIGAFSEELFYYKGEASKEEHTLAVRIKVNDALVLDDVAYFIIPEVRRYKILLITNSDTYLKNALESNLDFSLTVANPPVVPSPEGFDTVILGNIDKEFILPGMFKELRTYVEKSGNLVIIAAEYLTAEKNANLAQMMPLDVEGIIDASSIITIERKHEILENVLLENVLMSRYMKGNEKNESVVVAKTKNSPVLMFWDYGKGKVAFLGINPLPEWSNFYLSSSFPIFWFQMVKFLNKEETFEVKNFKSGEYLSLAYPVNMTNPSGREFSSKEFILDEVGAYNAKISGREERIAVNLADSKESNIRESVGVETINDKDFNIFREKVNEKNFLWQYLIILAIIFIIIEAIFYKTRGLI